jgi:hypothetical protein
MKDLEDLANLQKVKVQVEESIQQSIRVIEEYRQNATKIHITPPQGASYLTAKGIFGISTSKGEFFKVPTDREEFLVAEAALAEGYARTDKTFRTLVVEDWYLHYSDRRKIRVE